MSDGQDHEATRQQVLIELLTAGVTPMPSAAQLVTALADARRHVASFQARIEPLDDWLTGQMNRRGVWENAAVLAALEVPEYRGRAANLYREAHPERTRQLDGFLRQLPS
jgi:hypothetical protein